MSSHKMARKKVELRRRKRDSKKVMAFDNSIEMLRIHRNVMMEWEIDSLENFDTSNFKLQKLISHLVGRATMQTFQFNFRISNFLHSRSKWFICAIKLIWNVLDNLLEKYFNIRPQRHGAFRLLLTQLNVLARFTCPFGDCWIAWKRENKLTFLIALICLVFNTHYGSKLLLPS